MLGASGNASAALAGLERVIEICMADEKKPRMSDEERCKLITPVAQCMKEWQPAMAVQAMGCCALACATRSKKPYPRKIQEAANEANCIKLLVKALSMLGTTFDQPGREALHNIIKNDEGLTKQAVAAGASWLTAEGK